MVYEQNSPDLRSPEVSISVQVDCLLFFKKARLLATGMGRVTINYYNINPLIKPLSNQNKTSTCSGWYSWRW